MGPIHNKGRFRMVDRDAVIVICVIASVVGGIIGRIYGVKHND